MYNTIKYRNHKAQFDVCFDSLKKELCDWYSDEILQVISWSDCNLQSLLRPQYLDVQGFCFTAGQTGSKANITCKYVTK